MAMKTIYLALTLLLLATSANAQYYGRNRQLGTAGSMPDPGGRREAKRGDYVQSATDNMEKELQLDALQKAVVKDALSDYYQKAMAIYAEDLPAEGKTDKMKAEAEVMEKNIRAILTPAQLVKYEDMKKAKAKKNKKKGRTSSDDADQGLTRLDSLMMGNP